MALISTRKSVLITGCSPGGIGHALAKEFHSRGLHVIASARSRDSISDLEGMGISTIGLEVNSRESIEGARREVERLIGGGTLDFLVNNAGQNYTVPALDVDLDEARLCFETNFFSVIVITQQFTPLLIASGGMIINIGSVAAVAPYVFGSVYNASKAALHAYSRTLRLELEPYGVRVMVVVTGGVQSRIARTDRVLPAGSLYLEISEEYQRRVKHSQEGAMPAGDYAKGVVAAALAKRHTKWLWKGNKAWLIWFIRAWLGTWVFDRVIPGMFGLVRLRGLVAARGKKAVS